MSSPRSLPWLALGLALAEAASAETADFLRLETSARSAAMGGALSAAAEGADALSSNPAGLARRAARHGSFSHAELLEGAKLDRAAYVQPLGEDAAAGAELRRLSHPRIEGRDATRAPNGSFTAADTALGGSYGRKLAAGLWAGGTLRALESRIADETARSFSADLGAAWAPESSPVSLAATAMNLGPGLKLGSVSEPLPSSLNLGASWRPVTRALATAELKHRLKAAVTSLAFGGEFKLAEPLAARAGWTTKALQGGEGSAGGVSGLSAGFGLDVGRVTVDYAFSPLADELDDAHRVALTVRF